MRLGAPPRPVIPVRNSPPACGADPMLPLRPSLDGPLIMALLLMALLPRIVAPPTPPLSLRSRTPTRLVACTALRSRVKLAERRVARVPMPSRISPRPAPREPRDPYPMRSPYPYVLSYPKAGCDEE